METYISGAGCPDQFVMFTDEYIRMVYYIHYLFEYAEVYAEAVEAGVDFDPSMLPWNME